MNATGISISREYAVSACECLIDGGLAFHVSPLAGHNDVLWFTIYGAASSAFLALAEGQKIERLG
jgi:hypothetical protein